jgi:hypothetical protein
MPESAKQPFMVPARWRALKMAFKAFLQYVGPHLADFIWPDEVVGPSVSLPLMGEGKDGGGKQGKE